MKRTVIAVCFLVLLAAQAQGVRTQGMAGLLLPGPAAAYLNPAYTAFPGDVYGYDSGFSLPIGLLGLLRPQANPFVFFSDSGRKSLKDGTSPFDLLALYDQLTHPNEFLINPPQSPGEVVIDLSDPNNIQITDGKGSKLNFDFSVGSPSGVSVSKGLTPNPLFRIPFSVGYGLSLDIGVFAGGFGLGASPDAKLRTLLGRGNLEANTAYGVEAKASGQAGVSAGFSFASELPSFEMQDLGAVKAYVGGRGEAFYGLGYLEGTATATVSTDANKIPDTQTGKLGGTLFYSYPGIGSGYGVRADGGVAFQVQDTTFGLGIRNLIGFAHWSGLEIDLSDTSKTKAAERNSFGFVPAFYLNAATKIPSETGIAILGGDFGYDGSLFGHVGGEYVFGPARVRAGVGYEGGLKFGLGAGFAGPGFTLDTALSTHQAPIVGGTVFGLALSLGFAF